MISSAFPHLEAISPRAYPDRLSPSGPDLWRRKLPCAQISGSKPGKRIPSSATYSHTSSPINKSKFQQTIYIYIYIYIYTPMSLGNYNMLARSRHSSVGIATDYGLDGFRVPVGSRNFSSPRRPDRFWGPPSLLSSGYRGLFPRG
jgi:hypothetical protein